MNFQDLKTVEAPGFYIDLAVNRAKKRLSQVESGMKSAKAKPDSLQRIKILELERIETMNITIREAFMKILKSYPSIDNLEEYYIELIKLTLEYETLKKSLGAMNWAIKMVNSLATKFRQMIKQTREFNRMVALKKEFFGRFTSVIKQVKEELSYLEHARKVMRDYPSIKKMFTVCIAGFPNVGKSTLLGKLTPAKPEIKNYAFTTKKINSGFLKSNMYDIQFLDTPGTLNRLDKMNDVEKQAYLAIRYCANVVVYVFDLTEEHYTIDEQVELYNRLKKNSKEIIVYVSKTDILTKAQVHEFKKKYVDAYTDNEELLKYIKKKALHY